MSTPDPMADRAAANRAEAVQITRWFLPAYAVATLFLFVPPVLRMGGLEILPPGVFMLLGPVLLVVMSIGLVWWFLRLGTLGQWKPGGGPRFSLLAAAITGEYRSTEPEPPGAVGGAQGSPLGLLAVDVESCADRLTEAREVELAASVRAGLREAEALANALVVHERATTPDRLGSARAAMGAFEDHVVGLQRALTPGPLAEPQAWSERLEADLAALRAAGDVLRQRTIPPPE